MAINHFLTLNSSLVKKKAGKYMHHNNNLPRLILLHFFSFFTSSCNLIQLHCYACISILMLMLNAVIFSLYCTCIWLSCVASWEAKATILAVGSNNIE